ncbi:transmembrane protein 70 homolog, mitochondrial-like isoform X2 [Portunus trituberculatus]|uniref:transmembrane protein 70 homolog, mitochondrial-like isoform X2 n=1 Tax=Portunus trituberculatus TaxID=210409 RepID=UPI001E1CC592|nr:transmembrane protein 70 homolog, mitochondrial-like isoform X2 [Portunus trituberculatus]
MATVYGVLRTLQRQQREASALLLRLTPRTYSPVNAASFSQFCQFSSTNGRSQCLLLSRNLSRGSTSQYPAMNKEEDKQESSVDIGPGTWKEIYNGILSTQIKMVKFFSLSTSVLGLSVQPILFQKLLGNDAGVLVAVASFVSFFTFVTPLLIHWIAKKYVTCLEYDPEKDVYSATTLSFFLLEKKVKFTVDDVKVPEVPGMFTTFLVKNRPLFVDPHMFKEVEHYGRLMGYDRPIDFHLKEHDEKSD